MPDEKEKAAAPTDILTNIVAADLQVILQPVNKFLTDLQAPGVNVQAVMQDFAALQLSVMADLPILQSVGISNIAAALQAALNGWVANVTTPPVAEKKAAEVKADESEKKAEEKAE